MTGTTFRFQTITAHAVRYGRCPGCRRKARRSAAFEQTVNPYNRTSDGTPKTPREVRAAVDAEAAAWNPPEQHFWHDNCLVAAGNGGQR